MQSRHWMDVKTPHGSVRMKVSGDGAYAPEYEDCRRLALRNRCAAQADHRRSEFRISEKVQMKYYLTTPIYYVNAAPHIGHTYTTIAADTIKRLKRMQGFEAVLYHRHRRARPESGALRAGSRQDAGGVHAANRRRVSATSGRRSACASIDFIRTTDPRHHETVQWLFERCMKNGYVYKGSYTGQYCVFDELYVNDAKPGDPCPDCGRPTETVTEENYFFKLSAFADRLLKLYEDDPDFIAAGVAPQ